MKSNSVTIKSSKHPPANRAARWSKKQFSAATPSQTEVASENGPAADQERKEELSTLSGLDSVFLELP